jgi:hypothetical protein
MKSKKYQFKKLVKVKKNSNQNNGNKGLIEDEIVKRKKNLKTIPNKINSNQKDKKKIQLHELIQFKK